MKIPRQLPLKQIRKNCIDCCCGQVKAIRFCSSTECQLWCLRFGKFPRTVLKAQGKEWEQLFDKGNFEKGGKFSPEKEIDEYRL